MDVKPARQQRPSRLDALATRHGITQYAVLLSYMHAAHWDVVRTAELLHLSPTRVRAMIKAHGLQVKQLSDAPFARTSRVSRDALAAGMPVLAWIEQEYAACGGLRPLCAKHGYALAVAAELLKEVRKLQAAKGVWCVNISGKRHTASAVMEIYGRQYQSLEAKRVRHACKGKGVSWAEECALRLQALGIQATAQRVKRRETSLAGCNEQLVQTTRGA